MADEIPNKTPLERAEEHLNSLYAARRGKLGVCTRKMNDIKVLLVGGGNVETVNEGLEAFDEVLNDFKNAHESVLELVTEEEQENESKYYQPRMRTYEHFLKEVEIWKRADIEPQTLIEPHDSISNVSKTSSKTKYSKAASSVSSARLKIEAERAALLARQASLQDKHALEQQKAQLNARMEKMALETEIAAYNAKLKVLESVESTSQSHAVAAHLLSQEDGMNSYFENQEPEVYEEPEPSPVEFAALGAVPKTPLQRVLQQPTTKSSKPIQKTVVNHTLQQPTARSSNQHRINTAGLSHNTSHDNLSTVMQRQNEIADLLVLQHKQATLPVREIPMFDGDPLNFRPFMRAFEHGIEEKTSSHQDRLYYLEQYTSGQPKDLVRSCLHMEARRGYAEAKRLLKEHFGNEIKVTTAYMEKAWNWTNIKPDDGKGLGGYALYLRGCCNAMQDLQNMEELNLPSNIKLIMSKLPYKLREKWRSTACDILERSHLRAQFSDLVKFMEKQAKILQDPLYGDIQDPLSNKRFLKTKTAADFKQQLKSKSRGSSFATAVAVVADCDSEKPLKEQTSKVKRPGSYPSEAPSISCVFCAGEHLLVDCQQVKAQPHESKVEFMRSKGLCFGCLTRGHISKECKRRMTCQRCQRKHPTILHIEGRERFISQKADMSGVAVKREETVSSALVSLETGEDTGAGTDCALAIVPVQVKMANGNKSVLTYAFLDSGSSATFCTERLMRQLKAKGSETEILLRTMGQESPTKSFEISGLEIGNVEGDTFLALPKVYTQNKIPVTRENIPTQKDLKRWPYLKEVQLKEIDADVELLIGVNAPKAMEPWQIINSQGNGPYAVKTLFGWVMNGPLNNCTLAEEFRRPTVMANRITMADLGVILVNQYNHDFPEREYEERSEMSAEDRKFMEIVSSSITLKDFHYYLPLPFRNKDVVLPNNHDIAEQRALNITRRFKKDEGYAAEYKGFMEEMITKGYAEKVPQEHLSREKGKVWYIPHHGVHHKRKGTIRVVFDCSSSYKGTSLNSELLQGPDLANTLIGVLLRFWQEHIAMMADIEGMFHQVRVHEKDLDFLRFLWWPDGDTNKRLEEYRMTVHLFGAISSPSCANFALRKTAEDNCERYDEEVIQTVKSNFYVDDCLKSVATEEQAIALTKNLRDVCSQGGFKLTKWVSNSRAVLASIPDEHKAKQIKELDLDREKLPVERALGIRWNIESDAFTFRVTVKNRPLTRRGILSTVSSIYDPLGFLAPFVLKAKQILQALCKLKCGWDEVIPEEHSTSWKRWLSELDQLSRFQIDRCMMPENFGQVKTAQLHHFGDASEQGYGTASYLRFTNGMEKVHIAFILGKSRVTPLKQMTIPRLELAAATLAVRVDRMLRLELQIELEESNFWTDSQSVLKYIRNDTKRFHTFVANRVAVIRDLSKAKQWRYLNSKHNPADDASRGLHVETFLNSKRRRKGPEFLEKEEMQWPKVPEELGSIPPDDPEVRKDIIVNSTSVEEKSPTSKLIEYYSTWNSLKKAVAWMLKLKRLLRQLSQKRKILSQTDPGFNQSLTNSLKEQIDKFKLTFGKENLSVDDLDEAEKVIIQFEQRQHFKQEIALVVKGKQCAKRSGSICKLDPIVDNGILRVGGRLSKAAMPTELKNPMILPKDSYISRLILLHIHEQVGHSGRGHMLSRLRQRYWIPCANSLARKILKSCVFCRRMQARAGEQKMADLPQDRVSPDLPPFTHVGIDYFGPIEVKRGRAHVKRYGVIFTCLVSRAVHLEVASYLDTDSCINALRRFICRRGPVTSIRTDNGTNFVGAHRELGEALKELDHNKIQNELLKEGVTWSFNPPSGAHHGGVWERLIRLVKKILYSVLKEQVLDDEALQTALCEVEAIMNDRPITTVTNDPNDLEPLTPNHLLNLKAKPVLPPGLFQRSDLYSRRRWKQVQYITDLFWKRWIREYLPLMQERNKWNKTKRNFSPGDLVVIVDDTAQRNSWLMGRVVEALPGANGLVRSVMVKTKTNVLQRPINKLCLLLEAAE